MVSGAGQIIFYFLSPPQKQLTHYRPISLQAQRTTGMQNNRLEHEFWTLWKGRPMQTPPRAVPGKPQPTSRCETHHYDRRTCLGQTGGHCPALWDTLWNAEEQHLGVAQELLWNIYGGGPKARTEADLHDLGKNKHEKTGE